MATKEAAQTEAQGRSDLSSSRLIRWIVKPGAVLGEVLQNPGGTWRQPLLVLSLLVGLQVLVAAPLLRAEIAQNPAPLPQDFQYYPPETQEQYLRAVEAASGPAFTTIFPMALALSRVWVGWLLVGGLLFLLLTMMGSRTNARGMLTLAAWSAMPAAIREIVRILAMLLTRAQIGNPGLSGLVDSQAASGQLLRSMAEHVDLYLFWQFALVLLGLSLINTNQRFKHWASAVITFVLLILLLGLPGYLGAQVGSMTIIRPYF